MRELVIKKQNADEKTILDFDSLDFGFGIGDYYYNGQCNGSQIGFYFVEELGQKYVEHLFFNVYVGNDNENEVYTLDTMLKNLTPNEELTITLEDKDYEEFKLWYSEMERIDFHYYTETEIKNIENYKNSAIVKFSTR
jgi:hypothetical protein